MLRAQNEPLHIAYFESSDINKTHYFNTKLKVRLSILIVGIINYH
jgi:hypothetical protein